MDPSPAPPPLSLGHLLYERTPRVIVTPAILAVDVALYVAMIATSGEVAFSPETLVAWGAQFAPAIAEGEWWRLLTAMWLHAHPPHLILNGLVLWQLGGIVERLLGPLVFLIVYVLTGVVAAIASLEYHGAIGLSVGASGAIFGVAGVLLMVAFTGRGRLMTALRGSMISFVIYNAMAGFVLPRVDNAAHFGGLAGGLVIGWLVARRSLEARPRLMHTLLPLALTAGLAAGGLSRVGGRLDVVGEYARYELTGTQARREFPARFAVARDQPATAQALVADIERDRLPAIARARQRSDLLLRSATTPADRDLARAWTTYLTTQDQVWRLRIRAVRERRPEIEREAWRLDAANERAFTMTLKRLRPEASR